MYDGLTDFNFNYTAIAPALAESWTTNANASVWTFHLRKGVKFHDGTPFTSTAVKETFEYYVSSKSPWSFLLPAVFTVDDSDPLTAIVSSPKPAPDLGRNQILIRIISPSLLAKGKAAIGKTPVGAGPYRFISWQPGRQITTESFDGYWGGAPRLKNLVYIPILEEASRIIALEAGDVDIVTKVDPVQMLNLRKNPSFGVSSTKSWLSGQLDVITTEKPCTDVRVRQALLYGIDRQAIVKDIFLGQAGVLDAVQPPGVYGTRQPKTIYPYNPKKSISLLKAAGYGSGAAINMCEFAGIRILGEQVMEAINGMLPSAGFESSLDIEDPGVANDDLFSAHPKHQIFHIEAGEVTGGPLHVDINDVAAISDYTKNPTMNSLTTKLVTTPDGPARLQVMGQLIDLIAVELPWIPLYWVTLSDVFTSRLHGYQSPRDGYMPNFTYAYLK
jgi:peptide/nickel transport system substrate-binding protein